MPFPKMPRTRSAFRAVCWIVLLGVAGSAMADGDTVAEPEPVEIAQGRPIDGGFVILNGRYLPPPYVVKERGDDLLINEQVIPSARLAGARGPNGGRGPRGGRGPGEGMGDGPRKRRPWWNEGQAGIATWVERRLENDAMLLVMDDESAVCLTAELAVFVLDALLSDESTETKVQWLLDAESGRINRKQWAAIVKNFEPTSELIERVGPQVARLKHIREQDEASHRRLMSTAIFRSRPVRYGVTVATMGLAVVALGSLLSYRPNGQTRWREVDSTGEGVTMVIRNAVLLVLLGVLDLVFTLAAQQGGGFLELNPLGSELAASPFLLTSFKAASLLGACFILVMLRRYRGAQVASWWLCLVCTVLAFRWLTYNSMFLS